MLCRRVVTEPLSEMQPSSAREACSSISNLLEAAGGSFNSLEPPAQALVQAVAKRVVHSLPPNDPAMLQLVKAVPLLHARDYAVLTSASLQSRSRA